MGSQAQAALYCFHPRCLGCRAQCYSEGGGSAAAPSGPQPEPLAPKYSLELLNVTIQLLLLPPIQKTTVQQREQPHQQGTKPTHPHALPYNRSVLSGLACSLRSHRGKIPSACSYLPQTCLLSSQLSQFLFNMCCLAFAGVSSCVPNGTPASSRKELSLHPEKRKGGSDKVREEKKQCQGQNKK